MFTNSGCALLNGKVGTSWLASGYFCRYGKAFTSLPKAGITFRHQPDLPEE